MIARLKGTVVDIETSHLVIDVNGVGYLVRCSTPTIDSVELNQEIALSIETIIREDAISLYGFKSKSHQHWFRLLATKVQGVGAKSAMSLLSTLSTSALSDAINSDDIKTLTKAPGIGPKVAQRVINELKGKTPAVDVDQGGEGPTTTSYNEAVDALVSLGFEKGRAENSVRTATKELGEEANITEIISRAIKQAR